MNVTINTTTLAGELRLLNQVAPQKAALPILSNVLIETDMTGLRFAASDHEVSFQSACLANVDEPGSVTLPAKRLLDMIEQLPDTDVQIYTDRAHVHLRSGTFKSRLQTMSPDDFPARHEPPAEASPLPTAAFQAMINRVRYAISDKGKYVVNGALLTLTDTVVALVSTDGKRLAVTTMPRNGTRTSIIVPTKTLDALCSMFSEPQIMFSQDDRHLYFQAGARLLVSRTIDGQFPNYDRVIPRDTNKKALVNRAQLAAALRRVGIVSEESLACNLVFSQGSLEISSSSAQVGDADEQVAVDYSGDPIKVCCNWQFLLDFLEAASGQTVTISLKTETSPMMLTDGNEHLAVVMLMRN